MRVSISTVGSRGDVQPMIGLGRRLAGLGPDVTVATHEPFRAMVEDNGLRFAPLPGDPRQVLETEEATSLLATGTKRLRFARRFVELLRPWFRQLTAATAPVVAASDVCLYSPLAFTVWHQAQAQGVPTCLATLQPLTRTRSFPSVAGGSANLGPALNLASHVVVEQLFWQPLRREVNAWREHELGLPRLPVSGPFQALRRSGGPTVSGFSPTLVPRPQDWPDQAIVGGAWFLDRPHSLSKRVADFVRSGTRPFYFGFGSMAHPDPEATARIAVEAGRMTGRRVVLDAGWAGLAAFGDDVMVINDEPHHLLFPLMDSVVHHGGAGTTHVAARAGVPQIVVPFFADQPFWAARAAETGISAATIPRHELTVARLAEALGATTTLRRRAEVVGQVVASERGVDGVVTALQSVTGSDL